MEKTYKVLKIILLVLVVIALVLGGVVLYRNFSGNSQPDVVMEETVPPEDLAPDFTVYDLDGNAHSLSDYQGKPVILNFWASWCGPCKAEMPDFEEAYLEYGEEIQFLIVDLTDGVQETVTSASEYIAQQGYTFPVFYDTDLAAAQSYGVYAIPVTYFIDAQGCIRAANEGMIPAELLHQNIEALLATE